jgi:peptide/nickel transport system substrate-binding protein
MTAEDAKFAVDYTINPKNGAYGYLLLNLVERVETADKYTLKMHMKSPSPAFLTVLTDIKAFSVIPRGSLKEGVDKPTRYPPGTGPFKFVEWQTRQQIIFERHEDYWGDKALVDRLVMRPVRDATIRLTALRAGDIDMAERSPLEYAKQVAEGKFQGISAVKAAYADQRALLFNVADPPFNNKKLRHAVAHAINRKEVLNAAYLGFGEPNHQKYPAGHKWYFPEVQWPSYDMEKARALVKESGYKGEPVSIITSPEGSDQIMAQTLQAQLKKIGINVVLDSLEVGAYNVRERKGEFAFRFRGGDFYPDPWTSYGQDLRCEPDLKKRNANTSGYCDKEMDALVNSAETELDPNKRKALFMRILTKMSEDIPEIYVGFVPRFFTVRDHVKDFSTDAAGRFMPWGGGLTRTWIDK